jgi:uncharacterized membrane protein
MRKEPNLRHSTKTPYKTPKAKGCACSADIASIRAPVKEQAHPEATHPEATLYKSLPSVLKRPTVMEWYYAQDDQQIGPVSEDELQKLVTAGTVTPKTLVWHDGMPNWAAYRTVGESPEPPVASPTETSICGACGKRLPRSDMVSHDGSTICPECEPSFLQSTEESTSDGDSDCMGNTHNRDLIAMARACLNGNWGNAVLITLVYLLVLMGVSGATQFIAAIIPPAAFATILITAPLELGIHLFFLSLYRRRHNEIGQVFSGFSRYGTALGAYCLRTLLVICWSLLSWVPMVGAMIAFAANQNITFLVLAIILSIPAVIVSTMVSYMYSMTFFILADDPTVGILESLKRSRLMMRGMKWKLFCLGLRFMGWILLAVLTCYIGLLLLIPYMSTAYAAFYDDVKGRASLPE